MTQPISPAEDDAIRKRIADAAWAYYGTDTSGLAGEGIDACAAAVEAILKKVFGHEFVGGGGNPAWVPDLRAGLLEGGFRKFDEAAYATRGDIAIQNGQQDGTQANPYENHVGIVVPAHDGSDTLVVLSNSSRRKKFVYVDDLQFSNIGYGEDKMGPSRFYRYKP